MSCSTTWPIPADQLIDLGCTYSPDEVAPRVLVSEHASVVVWSSIWPARADARVRFELASAGSGTDLRFTLLLDPPLPDDDAIRAMRKRLGSLINGQLRHTYGQ
ncbi:MULTISPECIES: hypothetical protein [Rhodococcoides]|uniref:hypothetical protein n=1 Tax=Rhodococcoides TaxID=3259750 RepID=UPI0016AF9B0B|nr:hypothetical protein [Rhodococcus kroppenstedtii]NIL82377.1 hypothetical protein [Rhodococcus kroppenstedtii]